MSQTVGVRQGDYMAPVLILFMVIAFTESLEKKWSKAGLHMVEMRHHTHSPRDCGKITNHKRNKLSEWNLLSLFCILSVDNGAFTFATREQLKIELNLIYSQFKRFGLEMHIGRGSKTSKIECIFFPPPGFNTEPISVAEGIVTFCLHFKYLGS